MIYQVSFFVFVSFYIGEFKKREKQAGSQTEITQGV